MITKRDMLQTLYDPMGQKAGTTEGMLAMGKTPPGISAFNSEPRRPRDRPFSSEGAFSDGLKTEFEPAAGPPPQPKKGRGDSG